MMIQYNVFSLLNLFLFLAKVWKKYQVYFPELLNCLEVDLRNLSLIIAFKLMLSIPLLENTVHSAMRLVYFCLYNIKNQTISPCAGFILEVEPCWRKLMQYR